MEQTTVDPQQVQIEDHGHEVHCWGPPGCGKTSWAVKRIASTALYRGAGSVMVSSFTVAAAAELASRAPALGRGAIGTLHSHAYRALDRPPLHLEVLDSWNDAHPALRLTGGGKKPAGEDLDTSPEEADFAGATDGDRLAARMDVLRNRVTPREEWPRPVLAFAERWEAWKKAEGVIDFTDMVEIAERDTLGPALSPQVWFVDESQDNTRLELRLIRKWAQRMERLVLLGDDDQMIYQFRGATPDGLLEHPVAPADRLVLGQSYRVPAAVHRAAERWVHRLSRREDKPYVPREEEGVVRAAGLRYTDPLPLIREIDAALSREFPDPQTGELRPASVMVMGACSYMLDPLKHALRKAGVPFSNPWRRKRGDWNPLGATRGVSSKDRLLAYLAPSEDHFGEAARLWSAEDVRRWTEVVRTQGLLRHGARKVVAGLADDETGAVPYADLLGLFADEVGDEVLERVLGPDLGWFRENLLAAKREALSFPIRVVESRGVAALSEPPRLHIGTIHSFKGAEADVVIVLPDLSEAAGVEWQKAGDSRDSIIRQFYVALTRARHELVVCEPSKGLYVPPRRLIEGAAA